MCAREEEMSQGPGFTVRCRDLPFYHIKGRDIEKDQPSELRSINSRVNVRKRESRRVSVEL